MHNKLLKEVFRLMAQLENLGANSAHLYYVEEEGHVDRVGAGRMKVFLTSNHRWATSKHCMGKDPETRHHDPKRDGDNCLWPLPESL